MLMTDGEPWECPRVLETELLRLLDRLNQRGPISPDQLRRHCLAIEELIPMLPNRERLTQRFGDMNSLVETLARQPDPRDAADAAICAWRASLERVRRDVSWLRFSTLQRRRAAQRADFLLEVAQDRGYVDHCPEDNFWILTTNGAQAIEMMRMSRSM